MRNLKYKVQLSCLITLICSCIANANSAVIAYYPSEFYQNLNSGTFTSDSLRKSLFLILSSAHLPSAQEQDQIIANCSSAPPSKSGTCYEHHALGYTPARRILFGELHLQKTSAGYAIMDVYCEKLTTEKDFHHLPPGPDQIPDINVLNTEHTWPQSHFTSKFPREMQKSDLHILYPVLTKANSSRANLDFNPVSQDTDRPCPKARRGYGSDGSKAQYFEPPASHKGNVARAIFYFALRYQLHVPALEEASLKAWNHDDPPDEFERARNEQIMKLQGDRNPFIDFPELVDQISDF